MINYPDFLALNPGLIPPQGLTFVDLYLEYLRRECYYEDYLDLFRGVPPVVGNFNHRNTFNQINIAHLGAPGHNVLNVNPYPWTPIELAAQQRQINHILIAESALGETSQTYYYDVLHLKYTPYFYEPCSLFNINRILTKGNKLIELANNGVLLIDTFPYGVRLTNANRIALQQPFFFNDLCFRLNLLCGLTAQFLNIALIAPLTTSLWLINYSAAIGGLNICTVLYPLNELTNNGAIDHFNIWSAGNTNVNKNTLAASGNWHDIAPAYNGNPVQHLFNGVVLNPTFNRVNAYRKIATTQIGTIYGPKATLIAFALNI